MAQKDSSAHWEKGLGPSTCRLWEFTQWMKFCKALKTKVCCRALEQNTMKIIQYSFNSLIKGQGEGREKGIEMDMVMSNH